VVRKDDAKTLAGRTAIVKPEIGDENGGVITSHDREFFLTIQGGSDMTRDVRNYTINK
jgi:hypothetical protein